MGCELQIPFADLDDLVQQFDGTDAGKRFIEAWKRARILIDFDERNGYAKVWQNGVPVSYANSLSIN